MPHGSMHTLGPRSEGFVKDWTPVCSEQERSNKLSALMSAQAHNGSSFGATTTSMLYTVPIVAALGMMPG